MALPAAPAGFAGIEVAIGLLGLLMVLVAIALRAIWVHTFGAVFLQMAAIAIPLGRLGHPHPFGRLKDWNADVLNFLLHQQQNGSALAGYFFHAAAILLGWTARELRDLAAATVNALDTLEHAHLPKWTKAMIYALFPPALIARLVRAAIHANLPHIIRTTFVHTVHTVTHTVTRIMHATTGAVAIPGWVIRLPRRVGRLERERVSIWKRLRKLELVLGATGAAALLARAFGIRSVRCFRDGNAGRMMRRVCGMDASLLDDLLRGTLLLTGTLSLTEFAEELLDVTEPVTAAITTFVRD